MFLDLCRRLLVPGRFRRAAVTLRVHSVCTLVLTAGVAACGDDSFTGVATNPNDTHTVTLYALTGTPSILPAAYFFINETPVRPQLVGAGTTNFEVAFDISPNNEVLLMPARTLVAAAPATVYSVGLQKSALPFESITRAPDQGYIRDSVLTAQQGDVYIVQLVHSGCTFLEPVYAKMSIDSVVVAERRLVLSVMVNRNCGFRGLTPGLPSN